MLHHKLCYKLTYLYCLYEWVAKGRYFLEQTVDDFLVCLKNVGTIINLLIFLQIYCVLKTFSLYAYFTPCPINIPRVLRALSCHTIQGHSPDKLSIGQSLLYISTSIGNNLLNDFCRIFQLRPDRSLPEKRFS